MAHHRLGPTGEAERWRAKVVRWTEQAEQGKLDDPSVHLPSHWIQRLELHLLRDEAAAR
jgi:hypothetical protein